MKDIFQTGANKYFNYLSRAEFDDVALELFMFQYEYCDFYKEYIDLLGIDIGSIKHITQIPFLPISFFKTHKVISSKTDEFEKVFKSSSTTADIPSKHFVSDLNFYNESIVRGFNPQYGTPEDFIFLALLPSYLEKGDASLVYMFDLLMKRSGYPENNFYIDNYAQLYEALVDLEKSVRQVFLIGVTYALLDFAEQFPIKLNNTIVMETGGMKGRRKEMIREEVHQILTDKLGIDKIHSEYGMTELLSQSYSIGDGLFKPSGTMKVLVRDINDPRYVKTSGSGCLNIIDLSNVHSCAFIATDDIGKVYEDGSFEVLGRADNAMVRGCNLMIAD